MNYAAYTSTTPQDQPPLSLDSMLAIRRKLDAFLSQPEPLGEWMRRHGHPPESWLLVMPTAMRAEFDLPFPPHYVRFSEHVTAPTFIRRLVIGLTPPTF